MGYLLTQEAADKLFAVWSRDNLIYAPKRFLGGATFSDLDCIRYGQVETAAEIVFDEKSDYSFKEILLPLSETLFFFTEKQVKEAEAPTKGAIIFLRSCDLHALRRLDDIYLENGATDYYYKRLRDRMHFVLMGCSDAFESCFCTDMHTNLSTDYDLSFEPIESGFALDCRLPEWDSLLCEVGGSDLSVTPSHVTTTKTQVLIPENLTADVIRSSMWNEYDSRCIACGRCNFACPTCTCFTMQDLFYTDNNNAGERRRIQASCMVDGFTDVAGGGSYRKNNGERMRYKVLHKVLTHQQRFKHQMCVGCGRCDDICPEYISFSHCINKLANAMTEVTENAAK